MSWDSLNASHTLLESHGSTSLGSFEISVMSTMAMACVFLVSFCLLRSRYAWLYSPRASTVASEYALKFPACDGSCLLRPPPPLGLGRLAWLWPSIFSSSRVVRETAGVDAYMFIRLFEFGISIFAVFTLVAVVVLIPINTQGGMGLLELDKLSMSNIVPASHDFLYITIAAYAFSAFTLYLLHRLYKEYVHLRVDYLLRSHQQGLQMSVMVQDIPAAEEGHLATLFEGLYPGDITASVELRQVAQLEGLLGQRERLVALLEDCIEGFQATRMLPVRACVKHPPFCLDKVNMISHSMRQLEHCNRKVAHLLGRKLPCLSVGFVTFNSARSFAFGASMEVNSHPLQYTLSSACHPRDLFPPNLHLTTSERALRRLGVSSLVLVVILFWVVPVTVISSFVSIESLQHWLPVSALQYVRFRTFLESFIPSVLLSTFISIMPTILWYLSAFAGHESQSKLQQAVLKYYFIFVLFNCFFVLTISGSILGVLENIMQHPGHVLSLLGSSLPQVSMFFMSFTLFQALSTFPLQLLAPYPLIAGIISKRLHPQDMLVSLSTFCDFSYEYPAHLLIFVIGFTYAVVAPVLSPVCLVYFLIGWVVKRYQVMYMFVPRFETGGQFWPLVYDRIVVAMLVGQCTWVGAITLKEAPLCSSLLLPLPLLTYYVSGRIKATFEPLSTHLPASEFLRATPESTRSKLGGCVHTQPRQPLETPMNSTATATARVAPAHRACKLSAGPSPSCRDRTLSYNYRDSLIGQKSVYTQPALSALSEVLVPLPPDLCRAMDLPEGTMAGAAGQYSCGESTPLVADW